MESSHFSALALLVSVFLLVVSQQEAASHPHIHKFLWCLPKHLSSSTPVSDAIYTQHNSSFSSVLQAYIRNERFNQSDTPKPLLIVAALDESHVQAVVICAKRYDLQIRIRSGGHDYEGLSYVSQEPFIILDMFNLRTIKVDIASETAWAQAGATLGELYYSIANLSKTHAFPAGVCLTLGLGGHISGGGYGPLLRKYGLSSDNVIDAKVVDANGNILDREEMGEDLFWAIRGGGAASFAVVLAWKLKLVRIPETVTVFNVRRTLEEGAIDVLDQWQRVAPKIDSNLFIRAQPRVLVGEGKNNKTVNVAFIGLYLGKPHDLVKLVHKSFPLLGLQQKDCQQMPWIKSTLFWWDIPVGTPVESMLNRVPRGKYFAKFRSDYVQKPISKAGWEEIFTKMMDLGILYLQLNPYGGKMSQVHENATPFPHRAGNLFKIQYTGIWFKDGEGVTSSYFNATKELYDTMTPYASKNPREHFQNYRDIDLGNNEDGSTDFARGYFKGNLPRLLATKAQVDPDNFFRHEQSIPVNCSLI